MIIHNSREILQFDWAILWQQGHLLLKNECILCGLKTWEFQHEKDYLNRVCTKVCPPLELLNMGLSGEFVWWRMVQLSKLGFRIEYYQGVDQILCSVTNPLRGEPIDYWDDEDFGISPLYLPAISHGISTYSLDVGYRELIGLEFDLEWSKSVTARTITAWRQVQAIEKRESYSRSDSHS